jgi:hypothetical protein
MRRGNENSHLCSVVMPAQASIQYAAASQFKHSGLLNTGSPGQTLKHAHISNGNLNCRPCGRRDPYRVMLVSGKKKPSHRSCHKVKPVVMGPCVRRDDSEFVARQEHFTPDIGCVWRYVHALVRTRGPIRRDIRCRKDSRPAVAATNSGLWLCVPAFAGTKESL